MIFYHHRSYAQQGVCWWRGCVGMSLLKKQLVILWHVGKNWHSDHGLSVILGRIGLNLPIWIVLSSTQLWEGSRGLDPCPVLQKDESTLFCLWDLFTTFITFKSNKIRKIPVILCLFLHLKSIIPSYISIKKILLCPLLWIRPLPSKIPHCTPDYNLSAMTKYLQSNLLVKIFLLHPHSIVHWHPTVHSFNYYQLLFHRRQLEQLWQWVQTGVFMLLYLIRTM